MLTSAGIGNHAVRPQNGRLFPFILIPDHGHLKSLDHMRSDQEDGYLKNVHSLANGQTVKQYSAI